MILRITKPQIPPSLPPLRVGANARIGHNSLGSWIEGPIGGGERFQGAFHIYLYGSVATVGFGLILTDSGAVEPSIGRKKISGDGDEDKPELRIAQSNTNLERESWICVEVTPDKDGNIDPEGKNSKVEVVQRDHPIVTIGPTGRVPLALIRFKSRRPEIFQIAYFNFRYVTSKVQGGDQHTHFFL